MHGALLRSLDDGVGVTGEQFGDERAHPSLHGVVVPVLMVAGDDEGDWDFRAMLSGSNSGRGQCRMNFPPIQGLVSRAGLPAPDTGLHVSRPAECSLRGCSTIKEPPRVLTNERAEAK